MFLFLEEITPEICEKHPKYIYVFGDNLEHWGKRGQAVIRDCKNSYGIPTKRKPTLEDDAYFSDSSDEISVIMRSLEVLDNLDIRGEVVVLPTNMVGSGLADLEKRSPKIYEIIKEWWGKKPKLYSSYFGNLKNIEVRPVSIARMTPRWLNGIDEYLDLAPNIKVLMRYKKGKVSEEEYIVEFNKVLNSLNPIVVIEDILKDGDSVMLCYCGKGKFCHRHLVMDWLQTSLDITIKEYGTSTNFVSKGYIVE